MKRIMLGFGLGVLFVIAIAIPMDILVFYPNYYTCGARNAINYYAITGKYPSEKWLRDHARRGIMKEHEILSSLEPYRNESPIAFFYTWDDIAKEITDGN